MHPTISYKSANARLAELRQQAQRDAQARAARHLADQTRTWRTKDGARCKALFASGLQPSDAPGPGTVAMAMAIRATVQRFGIGGCVSQMAQEFGDHPEAAAERMRWVRSLLGLAPRRSAQALT